MPNARLPSAGYDQTDPRCSDEDRRAVLAVIGTRVPRGEWLGICRMLGLLS